MIKGKSVDSVYVAFGKLVRLNRERHPDMTQEKLGKLVGLSRVSIVNIERGRQHIALHQLLLFAAALKVRPEALFPSSVDGAGTTWLTEKLPPGTDKKVAAWAEKLITE